VVGTSYTIPNTLAPGDYIFRITALNVAYESGFSNPVMYNVPTPLPLPPQVVVKDWTVAWQGTNAYAFTAQWNTISMEYLARYIVHVDDVLASSRKSYTTTSTSFMSTLSPSVYRVSVVSSNATGLGVPSQEINFPTKPGVVTGERLIP
jgi:hypothetical protein